MKIKKIKAKNILKVEKMPLFINYKHFVFT